MATFEQLMNAAKNADAVGDTDSAYKLVQAAKQMRQQADNSGYMLPRAYDPNDPSVDTRQPDRPFDTTKAAMEGPIQAVKAYAGGLADQRNSPTMRALPEGTPDMLKRPLAAAGDLGMMGLSGLGTVYAAGAGAVGEMFGGSPTNERKLARDLMMMGEVAVPELAGVSSATLAAQKGASAANKVAQTSKPKTALQAGARAADDLGILPSLGAGGKVRSMTAAGFEKVPVTGGVIAKDAGRFVGEIERAYNGAVSRIGKATGPVGAGDALQTGLDKFVTKFKETSGKNYDAVGKFIPAETRIQAPNTVKAINDALAVFDGNPEIAKRLGMDKWAAIAGDLDNGLSWQAASDLRTSIGESVGKITGPLADMDQGKLKLAYATLTADLEAAAKAAGPKAESAWKRATSYHRRGAERITESLDKTISAKSPERAFEAFVQMTKKDRASSDVRRIYRIKASMPRDEWNNVAASIVDRMGKAPSGQQGAAGDVFSPGAFLTEWNKMSPEAKQVLLTPEARSELNKLASVAELSKAANAERNFSNTGTAAGWLAIVFGAPSHTMETAGALAGSYVSAKGMTSAPFLKALNKAARGDMRAINSLAKQRGPIAQDAKTILRISAAETAGKAPANVDVPPLSATARQ